MMINPYLKIVKQPKPLILTSTRSGVVACGGDGVNNGIILGGSTDTYYPWIQYPLVPMVPNQTLQWSDSTSFWNSGYSGVITQGPNSTVNVRGLTRHD